MLAVSPVRRADVEECGGGASMAMEEIGLASMDLDLASMDLDFDFTVDDIDFGDFFLRLEDGDALPDLEVDPGEVFTKFDAMTSVTDDGVMDQEVPSVQPLADEVHIGAVDLCSSGVIGEENTASPDVEEGKGECNPAEELAAGNGDLGGDSGTTVAHKSPSSTTSSSQEAESRHKSSSKYSQGKKKAKVPKRVS